MTTPPPLELFQKKFIGGIFQHRCFDLFMYIVYLGFRLTLRTQGGMCAVYSLLIELATMSHCSLKNGQYPYSVRRLSTIQPACKDRATIE